jgi:hypothetical protein
MPSSDKRRIPIGLVFFVGVAAAGAVAWYAYSRTAPPEPKPPVLTTEAREYVRGGYLKLTEVDMSAKESFSGAVLVEITGNITNGGPKPVKLVEISCVFYDVSGLVVLRERVPIVSSRMGMLSPGQTRKFRLPFDSIPESWNQAMPQLVIAQIVFG